MKTPVTPLYKNEAERLKALADYDILDTLPEQAFDDLTVLLPTFAKLIDSISLVDANRQWFKSNIGLKVRETPREMAFCSHPILHPENILVIPTP